MEQGGKILLDLLILFVAAKIGGEIAERIKQPAVVGEVLIGIAIGSGALGIISRSAAVEVVSTIGVMILLFLVGLETDIEAIRKIGLRAIVVATLGVIVPFVLGFGLMYLRGSSNVESMFVATALVATSVGITARVLSDLGVLGRVESQIILAAAVVDDILGLLVLSMVTAVAKAGVVPAPELALTLGKGALFVIVAAILPPIILNRHEKHIDRLRHSNALLSVAIAACLGFSVLAEGFGLAAIVGAFLAGLGFANVEGHSTLKKEVSALAHVFSPLFFVAIGMMVDIRALVAPQVLTLGLAITALAIIGKVIGCGLAAWNMGPRSAMIVGVGMAPRGEVGLIVATIGLGLGAIPRDLVSAIVLMSILTTIVVPPLMPHLFSARSSEEDAEAEPGISIDY